jgi:hypothetical protein
MLGEVVTFLHRNVRFVILTIPLAMVAAGAALAENLHRVH